MEIEGHLFLRGHERLSLSRRDLLKTLGLLVAGNGLACAPFSSSASGESNRKLLRIPLIHITDLYHPPQDPDDQIDLATILALEEYDVKGVILDVTERFLRKAPDGHDIARDQGFLPVAQMAHISGKTIPVAQGPIQPLESPGDRCENSSPEEELGIRMILRILEECPDLVTISVTGSPRTLTAAYNRQPGLVVEKTRAVLLNAGSTGGEKVEWNVQLDLSAYIGLWNSDLPIHWFPPGTDSGAFDAAHERGTYWRVAHADLFEGLPPLVQRYFAFALSGDRRGEGLSPLMEPVGEKGRLALIAGERNLWATASLVMGANRVLARTDDGWRFLSELRAEGKEVWSWWLDPIRAEVDGEGRVAWAVVGKGSERFLFGRRPGREFGAAMTEALNALLRGMAD